MLKDESWSFVSETLVTFFFSFFKFKTKLELVDISLFSNFGYNLNAFNFRGLLIISAIIMSFVTLVGNINAINIVLFIK